VVVRLGNAKAKVRGVGGRPVDFWDQLCRGTMGVVVVEVGEGFWLYGGGGWGWWGIWMYGGGGWGWWGIWLCGGSCLCSC
jgi:hypothetical protein